MTLGETTYGTVLAHQGGWDEILMVAGPLAVFAAVLFLANRRANIKLAAANGDSAETTDSNAASTEN